MNNEQKPLSGIRVIELGTHVAVPNATRFMADWGAEVIKVENFKGDEWRLVGQNNLCPITNDENPFFTLQNANKKFISLNLKHPDGMAAMKKLLSESDVFISNVRMPSLVKLGLDYDALFEEFPGLVYGHFTGYGYEGEDAAKPGFDSVAFWARSGAMIDWGAKGDSPILPPTGTGDATVGSILCSGILAALIGRKTTGKGTFVSSSLMGSAIWYCGSAVLSTQYGNVFPKEKNKPSNPFGYQYECNDGEWLMVGVVDYSGAYPKMCKILGLEVYIEDERFSSITQVRKNIDVFIPLVTQAFKKKTRDEWIKEISNANIVCGKIGHMSELYTDPQALANGFIKKVTFANGNSVGFPTVPVEFSAYDTDCCDMPGVVGRDTEQILKAAGYSRIQIDEAKKNGAVK